MEVETNRCVVCERLLPPNAHGRKRFCSRTCKQILGEARVIVKHRAMQQEKKCIGCGEVSKQTSTGKYLRFCSTSCRVKHSGRKAKAPIKARRCELCDREFLTNHPLKKYCSHGCRERIKYLNSKQKTRQRGHKKRCEKFGVKFQYINPKRVFARDRLICQICLAPCDPAAKFPDPASPTIDHKIPISKGGEHTIENLQCAHWACNAKKRDYLQCQEEDRVNLLQS